MIDAYAFGRVVVNGASYEADVIVFPDRVESNWWRKEGHRLQMEDLGTVVGYGPDVLVVGSGSFGMMDVPLSTIEGLESRGTSVIVLRTSEACTRFNTLLAERKRVAAALHLTC